MPPTCFYAVGDNPGEGIADSIQDACNQKHHPDSCGGETVDIRIKVRQKHRDGGINDPARGISHTKTEFFYNRQFLYGCHNLTPYHEVE